MFRLDSLRESLMRSRTVCSFCFWAISDWVTSATFSFSPSSFSEAPDSETNKQKKVNGAEPAASSFQTAMKHFGDPEIFISHGSRSFNLTKEFLQDLPVVQIFSQILDDDSLPHQNVIYPVDQHLECQNKALLGASWNLGQHFPTSGCFKR